VKIIEENKHERQHKRKFNKLITEKSPYLLQHAENPVDWYPWGKEAFEKAKLEDKPIFLSVGYSTCHWCHVMAHESFEDPIVAKHMNDVFVSIKVDREERPDIDKIYMTVCQIMTNSGGWPLTILMTPDKKPFFAGTYFPKESRFGRIGLIDLINRVNNLWKNERKELLASSEKITFALQDINVESPGRSLEEKVIENAYSRLSMRFDEKRGGFGSSPKFPSPHNLLFLLRYWKRTDDKNALDMVESTLKAMRRGGIYDQIGFGFHRYSTDVNWLVPHFEKMLYDQALLALSYLETYQATGNIEYGNTAKEIFTYVLRDMSSPEGGFYSAEDADSEGKEGKFYVWTKEEIGNILEKEDAELIESIYNVETNGNYMDEATREKTGKNILHLKVDLSKLANPQEESFHNSIESMRQKLFNSRETRIRPHRDDKILTDWNGLMIAALAKGGFLLNEQKYIEAAKKAVSFILKDLRRSEGRLLHRYRDGTAEIDAYVDDYSFLIWALINLYEATFNTFYLKTAIDLTEDQITYFWDSFIGGFFFTAEDGEKLLTRQKEIYDGAIPSGNSVAMLNLLKLAQLTGNQDYKKKADLISRVFAENVRKSPVAHTFLLTAVNYAVGPTYSLVIAGDTDKEDTNDMLSEIKKHFLPNKSLIFRPTEKTSPEIDDLSNFVQYFGKLDGKAAAYVCINKTCKVPTNDVNKALEYLSSKD